MQSAFPIYRVTYRCAPSCALPDTYHSSSTNAVATARSVCRIEDGLVPAQAADVYRETDTGEYLIAVVARQTDGSVTVTYV